MRTRHDTLSALFLLATTLLTGCSSGRGHSGRLMYDFLPHDPERIERIVSGTRGQSPEDTLIALAAAKGPSKRKQRSILEETNESLRNDGPAARGVAASPSQRRSAPEGEVDAAASTVPSDCQNRFCAGVASRPLDPFIWDPPPPDVPHLAERPSSGFLRWLSGPSHPPLAGYLRLRKNPFGVPLRLADRSQYYAHLFKDSQGTAPGGPVIQAKALVLRDPQGKYFYWVKTDLIGAFQDLRQAVIDGLGAKGISTVYQDNLLLHGTHTHSGLGALNPRYLPQILTVDLFVKPLWQVVVNQIVGAIVEADGHLQPARIGVGSTENCHLTRNRRATCKSKNDPKNSSPDPTIGILRIDRVKNDKPLATVFNFAVHGTSLNDDNVLLSPDNMGWAEWFIEQQIGGMALFFNGAQGDVTPHGSPTGSGIRPETYVGKALSDSVLAARPGIRTSEDVELRSEYCHIDDPDVPPAHGKACPDEYRLERFQFRPLMFIPKPFDESCYLDRGDSNKVVYIEKEDDPPFIEREGVTLAAFRIEISTDSEVTNTLVMTLPGEPITDIGKQLKHDAPSAADNTWIFGLSNAHMGYIVTREEYEQGGYEAGANFFGRTQGENLAGIALHLATEVFQPPSSP